MVFSSLPLSKPPQWRCAKQISGAARRLGTLTALLLPVLAAAQALPATSPLPPEVEALLLRAKVPREALAAVVLDAAPPRGVASRPLLSYQAQLPMNPASVMKLVTTYAGLDLLGPAYTWPTPVYLDGILRGGVLQGNLVIQGRGDPKLVMERLWLLMRRVQGLGIESITGDILLDRSAFALAAHQPGEFDGEPLRPYNAAPDALLINFKSVVMTFSPQPGNGIARVAYEPSLADVNTPVSVPLQAAPGADCPDYRAALKADFSDPFRIRFAGAYPAACGEKTWAVAYVDPASYAERAVAGMWRELGGKLGGRVREGRVPAGGKPAFEMESPSLFEVVRDINKYSNNVMAQQLFLTLSLPAIGAAPASAAAPASVQASQEVVRRWWQSRISAQDVPVLDNGSGLSRQERVTPQGLARMLQVAYASGGMPELMASLPISGVDGTLKRSTSRVAQGSAHLKTGTLRDATALAGYVHGANGRRWVVVAMVNHANASAARPALEALVEWTIKEGAR